MESKTRFTDELKLFESIIAFGNKLVNWEKEIPTIIEYKFPIIVQLSRTIEIVKAIKTLIESNEYSTILILLRSQIESYLYLSYLLEEDTINRCLAYNYWHILEEKKGYEKATPGTEMNKQLLNSIQKDKNNNISLSFSFSDYSEKIKELEGKISLPIYAIIQSKVEELKRKKTRRPNWYQYFNEKNENIKELAYSLELQAAYEGEYRYNSKSTHSNDAHASYFERELENYENTVIECVIESSHFIIQIYKTYIEKRQNDKIQELNAWFYGEIESLRSRIIEKLG